MTDHPHFCECLDCFGGVPVEKPAVVKNYPKPLKNFWRGSRAGRFRNNIAVGCTSDQRRRWESVAKRRGMSLSEFVRDVLDRAAS